MKKDKGNKPERNLYRAGHTAEYESPKLRVVDLPIIEPITTNEVSAEIDRLKREAEESLYKQAVKLVLETRNARNTFLRYKLKISQRKATALIERMADEGILGPYKGSNIPREILKKA